jgi:hypothetical protein
MDKLINSILAKLFDNFKAKNPQLAGFVILLLGTVIYLSENGLPELIGADLSVVVKWVSVALVALTGSRTTNILHPKEIEKK